MKVQFCAFLHDTSLYLENGFKHLLGENNTETVRNWREINPNLDLVLLSKRMFRAKGCVSSLPRIMSQTKVAVYDTEDDPLILRKPLEMGLHYFKRELASESFDWIRRVGLYTGGSFNRRDYLMFFEAKARLNRRVHPLPLSYLQQITQAKEKTLLCSFLANVTVGNTWPYRLGKAILGNDYARRRISVAKTIEKYPHTFVRIGNNSSKGLLSGITEDYMQIIANSYSAVAVRGAGYDTYRYWEIPLASSLLVAEKSKNVIPNNFEDGVHALFFRSLSQLREKIEYVFSHKEESERMAQEGHKHLMKYHTPEARAKYILEIV